MKKYILAALLFSNSLLLKAQENEASNNGRLAPKELAIPTSPLFHLLGVEPNQVARSTDVKDFKVDWSFKNRRLNPNLSIQAQPIWELFYNRKKH